MRLVNAELLVRKRQLRSEIARSRLDTQAVLAEASQERRRLTSWRTYFQRFPWASLGIAFGVGLWLASARPGRRLPRSLASRLIQMGVASARSRILADLLAVWAASKARRSNVEDADTQ